MRYILTCETEVSKLEVLSGGHPTMDYKIGEKVVYPNHGVGIIEQINFGVLNGRTEKYYMLRILSSGLKVMVPQSNAPAGGLRPVIRPAETRTVPPSLQKSNFHFPPD